MKIQRKSTYVHLFFFEMPILLKGNINIGSINNTHGVMKEITPPINGINITLFFLDFDHLIKAKQPSFIKKIQVSRFENLLSFRCVYPMILP